MNADEQNLIRGLFDRMSGVGPVEKDADADALIRDLVARHGDAAYLLVQSVLVQEQALQKADERIKDLQTQIDTLEKRVAKPEAVRTGVGGQQSSGFLGSTGSVPSAGTARASSGFGSAAREQRREDAQPANRSASGGFMAQAMTTAAGVAGGMLLANGISSLFSSGSASAATPDAGSAATDTASAGATDSQANATTDSNTSDASSDTAAADDTRAGDNVQEADDGGDSWFGGDDWGDMGDFDI